MMKKINNCLFKSENCTGIASSKEHVIHNSRRKFLQDKGADLGNEKARFKGITCANCNEYLGRKEGKYNSSLAIATLWKVIAGNINGLFEDNPWCLSANTNEDTLNQYQEILKKSFINDSVFPENMLGYDLTYSATTNSHGKASLNILTVAEGIIVVNEIMKIENTDTGYSESRMIDILVYHTHNSNSFRMLFFLPLIPNKNSEKFANCKIKITHKGFGIIANELFENETTKITLNKIYSA